MIPAQYHKTSSHGIGIAMFQHPDKENMGIEQERYPFSTSNGQISKLPSFYTSVPVVVASKNPHVPN